MLGRALTAATASQTSGPLAAAALPLLCQPSSSWSAAWQVTSAAAVAAPWPSQLRGLAARAAAAPAQQREAPDPYTTRPRNYIQLLQHIQRARDLDRIETLLRAYGPKFDAVHVAAAMVAVPKLMQLGPTPAGTKVSRAVAKQRSRQPAYLMAELQRAALGCLPRLHPREVAHMAWATAATRNLLPRNALPTSARAAEPGAAADAGQQWQIPRSLQKQQVGTIQFMGLLLDQLRRVHMARKDRCLSGADTSQLMYALGKLRAASHRRWLVTQVVKAAGQQQLTAKQAALVLWGMGRLGWREDGAVAALGEVLVRERLYLRPPYAAAALAGLARLGWRDTAIVEAACKVFEEQMYSARPQELALLVNTTSRLGAPLPASLATSLQKRVGEQLEKFTPLQLSLVLDGLSRQGRLGGELAAAVVEGIAAEEAVVMAPGDAVRFLSSWARCRHLDLDAPATRRAAALVGEALLPRLARDNSSSSSSKSGEVPGHKRKPTVMQKPPSQGGLSAAAAAELAHALCLFGLEGDDHRALVKALSASLVKVLVTPGALVAGGRSPLAQRPGRQVSLGQLASLVNSFQGMGQLRRELADAANAAMLDWLSLATRTPDEVAEEMEARAEKEEALEGGRSIGTGHEKEEEGRAVVVPAQVGKLCLTAAPTPSPSAAADASDDEDAHQQQQQQQQQLTTFRRAAAGGVEVVRELSAAQQLNPAVASQLCAALLPHLEVLKPRTVAMLLWAVARHMPAATSEGGRALLVEATLPWVEQQLLGEGAAQPSITCLANAAAAIAAAGQHGLMVESGPLVVQQLYEALVPRVTAGRVTEVEAGLLAAALEAVPCEELTAALAQQQLA